MGFFMDQFVWDNKGNICVTRPELKIIALLILDTIITLYQKSFQWISTTSYV